MEMLKSNTEEAKTKVLNALEKEGYRWRTLAGIAKETGLPVHQVKHIIFNDLSGDVVRASVRSKGGKQLFTTKRHYLKNSTPKQKFRAAFSNRLA
ncbi:MAG: hypothetical protein ACPGSB_00810 [Opitutales bacterium]